MSEMTKILIDREVVEQAIDALDEARSYTSSESMSPSMTLECNRLAWELRDALRAALEAQEQPAQEQREPMSIFQARAIAGAVFPYSQSDKAVELIRDVEAHHKIGGAK